MSALDQIIGQCRLYLSSLRLAGPRRAMNRFLEVPAGVAQASDVRGNAAGAGNRLLREATPAMGIPPATGLELMSRFDLKDPPVKVFAEACLQRLAGD